MIAWWVVIASSHPILRFYDDVSRTMTMKHLALGLLTYLAAALQAGAHFRLPASMAPSVSNQAAGEPLLFLPLVVLLAAFEMSGSFAVLWAAMIGVISDALHPGPLGVDMLCAVLITGVILQVDRRYPDRSVVVNLLLAAGMAFLLQTASLGLRVVLQQQTVSADQLLTAGLRQTTAMMAVAAVCLLLWNAVRPLLPRRRHSENDHDF